MSHRDGAFLTPRSCWCLRRVRVGTPTSLRYGTSSWLLMHNPPQMFLLVPPRSWFLRGMRAGKPTSLRVRHFLMAPHAQCVRDVLPTPLLVFALDEGGDTNKPPIRRFLMAPYVQHPRCSCW